MLSRVARESADRYRSQFEGARPFKHVCMDGFFHPAAAQRLRAAFPTWETADALNEFGVAGRKAVVETISDIGPAYRDLAAFLGSDDFSSFLSRVTGIDGLMWPGESVYGGGTHENLDGNHLDAHVDFNYHDQAGLHRRLNLIIFLTEEWSEGWGGELQFHSDPRVPERDEIRSFAPAFNRCVLFETNERSWHGFPRITLPP